MFDRSAAAYDWICSTMSFGTGLAHRRTALRRAGFAPGMRLLDVASGTGLVARAALALGCEPATITRLDPSIGMLRNADHSALRGSRGVRAIAEQLPFPDARFDFVAMGYALRHVADLRATFAEYRRVLVPGGRLLLLEISRPASRAARLAARAWFAGLVVPCARLRGKAAAELMQYYWRTIDACVEPPVILEALVAAQFTDAQRATSLGVFSEYTAMRPEAS